MKSINHVEHNCLCVELDLKENLCTVMTLRVSILQWLVIGNDCVGEIGERFSLGLFIEGVTSSLW